MPCCASRGLSCGEGGLDLFFVECQLWRGVCYSTSYVGVWYLVSGRRRLVVLSRGAETPFLFSCVCVCVPWGANIHYWLLASQNKAMDKDTWNSLVHHPFVKDRVGRLETDESRTEARFDVLLLEVEGARVVGRKRDGPPI